MTILRLSVGKKLEMFRKKLPQLGIDIGNSTIKLAMVKPGKKPKVEFLSQVPVPEGAVMAGTVLDPEPIGLAIRSELGIWEQDFAATVAVSGHAVSLRLLKLPLLKKQELAQAVEFESGNVLPFPLASAYWDYEVCCQKEHCEVLVAAAEKKFVDQLLSALSSAGIIPQAVEPSSMALARSLRAQLGAGLSAVLDLGANSQELTIYSKGVPVFYRMLPGTGEDFAFAVSVSDGELVPALLELLQELRRSFDYLGRQREGGVERLILVGYGASLEELPQTLQSRLGIQVTVGDPLLELDTAKDLTNLPKERFAVALGLALREVWG